MDELTRERYPHGVPYAERYARPRPVPTKAQVDRRRIALCGTADLAVIQRGGNDPLAERRPRKLMEVIRTWRA